MSYWEAWDAGNRSVTVHWGALGETGATKDVGISTDETADDVIDRESREPRATGYEEIEMERHTQMVVQFKTKDEWGDSDDLGKRHHVDNILNECLGWTGNGHYDGGDIGSGTINSFVFAVDADLAKDAIVRALTTNGFIDGAIIAVEKEVDYEVVWPEDFKGDFSII